MNEKYSDVDVKEITGIDNFVEDDYKKGEDVVGKLYKVSDKVFFVKNGDPTCPRTVEVRTDNNLKDLLIEKYESVMESRYFGKYGIEIVMTSQVPKADLEDLIRLSYNLTK